MWWEHWIDEGLSARIDSMVKRGIVKAHDGRLRVQSSMLTSPYWMHIGGSLDCRNCLFWFEIFFKELGIIHSFCRYHCWKCVTRPRSVKELIQVYNLMYAIPFHHNFINPIPGKAGLDVRGHTDQPYGVFQYALSKEQALQIKDIMVDMIATHLPNESINGKKLEDTVFVKRSCTEMEERVSGKDNWWNTPQTPAEWEIERRIEEVFDCPVHLNVQPAWLKDKTLHSWLKYANSIGDRSAVRFLGSDPFNVHSVKYEKEVIHSNVPPEEREETK